MRRAGAADRGGILSALLRRGWVARSRRCQRARLELTARGGSNDRNPRRPPRSLKAPTEPFKRAVGLPAGDRAPARARGLVCGGAAGPRGRQGAPARAAAQAQFAGGGDRARPRRFDRASARLPRSGDPPPPAARRAAVACRVRGGRAGAGRGDRRAAHAGVAQNLSAMLDDRFHRGKFDEVTDRADAPIEDASPDRARAPHRAGSAGCGQQAGRFVAPMDRGSRRAQISIGWRRWWRTSVGLPMRSMTFSTRSTWRTTAAAIPRTTRRGRSADSRADEDESSRTARRRGRRDRDA